MTKVLLEIGYFGSPSYRACIQASNVRRFILVAEVSEIQIGLLIKHYMQAITKVAWDKTDSKSLSAQESYARWLPTNNISFPFLPVD